MAEARDSRGVIEPVAISSSLQPTTRLREEKPWRHETPLGDGLLVSMYAIPDVTDPDVLDIPFHFQCPPLDSFGVAFTYNWTTWQTLRKGEFISAGGRGLAAISFASLFVSYNASWTFTTDHAEAVTRAGFTQQAEAVIGTNPRVAANRLKAILKSGTPFGLVVGNHGYWGAHDVHWGPPNGNAAVLTSLGVEERAGEPDARYTNVTFQEYRSPELERRRKGRKRHSHKRGRNLPATITIHSDGRVVEGAKGTIMRDATLRKLAAHFYGTQSRPAIQQIVARKAALKSVAPSRNLGEWLRSRHERSMKVIIAVLPTASTNTPSYDDEE